MKFKLKYEAMPYEHAPLIHKTKLNVEFSSDGESEAFEQSAYNAINEAFAHLIEIIEGSK